MAHSMNEARVMQQLCDETSSLLEGKAADRAQEILERAAQRLFSDDAGLWPQYRARFYMRVLPPLVGNMTETEVCVTPSLTIWATLRLVMRMSYHDWRRHGTCIVFGLQDVFGESTNDI